MSSVVYYKFKSQKEPSRVNFDGTGISVFDLKREIILANKLTSTAESFDLILLNPDTKEEYKDDTEVVPRSISVGARRLPSGYPGASRYVTGGASMKRRREVRPVVESATNSGPTANATAAPAGSEEEQIASMLASQTQQWEQAQEHMSQQQFISTRNANNANVPDHPPPPGYICYRCGQKGHWIQACPTNNDPNWEGKRVKRTTGIPKSMLKTVQRPADDDQNTYMVNEDGEYVVAVADNKSWQQFKDKTQAAQNARSSNSKPLDPELECPLSHKLFVDPVKTPCCNKTYSREPIETHLFEHDFHCPNCDREELLLDQLIPDDDMNKRIEEYKSSENSAKRKRDSDDEPAEGDAEKKLKADDEPESKDKEDGTNGEESVEAKIENVETTNPQNMPMMPGMPMPPWMMMMPPPPMMMPPFMPPFMPQNQNQNQTQNQRR